MTGPRYVNAATTTAQWQPVSSVGPVLVLWHDNVTVIEGTPDEIRQLLHRCLAVIPTDSTERTEHPEG